MIKRLSYTLFLICLWMGGMSVSGVVWSAGITLTVTYVLLPLLYKACPCIPRHLIFLNYVYFPFGYYFKQPTKCCGFEGVDNFYLTVQSNVILGIWHVLPRPFNSAPPASPPRHRPPPSSTPGHCTHSDYYENELRDGRPVVLYLHGNTSCRAQSSRVGLYKVLADMGFHVIAFDYRGYGDSSRRSPSERGVVEDTLHVYSYIRRIVRGNAAVIVWGHSLGTGVACRAVRILVEQQRAPDALVLEAPFNNIMDEVAEHPLSAVFCKMPFFEWLFLAPLEKAGLKFTSDVHIEHIKVPVLILHAEDDMVVPFKLGRRLYEYGLARRPENFPTIRFVPFPSRLGLGHKWIHRSSRLPDTLKQFLEDVSVL